MISGIILASGFSKRMGRNKLLLPVGGVPVIERVIIAASQSKLDELIIVCSGDEAAEIGIRYGLKVVHNSSPSLGQSHSIVLGVESSSPGSEAYMFLVGDQPFITDSIINTLLEHFIPGGCSAVVPIYNGTRGNPVIFASTQRERLSGLKGDSGGRVLLKGLESDIIKVSFEDEKPGFDMDTKTQYEALLELEDENE